MSFFAGQHRGIYSLDYRSTCRLEARQVLIYQCISDLTGGSDKYNDSKAVHLYSAFSDISLSAKYYKIASALTVDHPVYLLMNRAYEGDETRAWAVELGYIPVVPPKSNRINPWEYDKELYKQRNQVERLFRRLKRFRRIFTRYDKLDIIFFSFVYFALLVDALM